MDGPRDGQFKIIFIIGNEKDPVHQSVTRAGDELIWSIPQSDLDNVADSYKIIINWRVG